MSALLLKPALSEKVWGGRRLKEQYNMKTDIEQVGEAWVLSCHKDGLSVVTGGEYDGLTLNEVIEKKGKRCLGSHCENAVDFPILIKIIDASDKLSVQVHPDDAYAQAHETDKRGKTEAWYIIDGEEDSELIFGFKETISNEEFRKSITDNTVVEKLNHVKIKSGDVAFIKSGTIHAIGAGILLAEVQQSCNTTYRVYDYNRPDLDGKPRELHVDKAVDVTKCTPPDVTLDPQGKKEIKDGYAVTLLRSCEYFTMSLVETSEKFTGNADETSFVSLLVLDGEGELVCKDESIKLYKGASVFIPAGDGEFAVTGNNKILLTRV